MTDTTTTDKRTAPAPDNAPGLIRRYVDFQRVSPLFESFAESSGVASAIIEPDGTVLMQANWQPLCTDFHRRHPRTALRCQESDTSLAGLARDCPEGAIYTCLNGLTDAVAPIVFDGQHLANAFIGQFFTREPDLEHFRGQAAEWDFDEDDYLAAVARVPVVSEQRARSMLAFLASSTDLLVGFGLEADRNDKAERRLRQTLSRLNQSVDAAVGALSRTVEMRDPYTAGHQIRVAELALAIGERLRLRPRMMTSLRIASLIHDLGKIAVPAEVLAKPGRLSDTEWSLLQKHPDTAFEILREMKFPGPVARIIRDHHERLDGSGYPRGLEADEIRLESRIIAVADVVEAMSSHRPYRPALGMAAALAEVRSRRGLVYDERAVAACATLFDTGFDFSPMD